MPPALLLWFAIHPWVRFWRRFGAGWTYALLGGPVIALMAGLYLARESLLGADLGTHYVLIALGILFASCAVVIGIKRKKYLTFRILCGVPELSRTGERGKLLQEGIYAKIRHPRYLEVALAVLSYSLIANYAGLYVLTVLSVLALYAIVLLEERELRERFGSAYEEYARSVPRFLPRPRTPK